MTAKRNDTEFYLPLDQLIEDKAFNVRIEYGDIDGLAIWLMTSGQLEPITVREEEGRFFLVDGHRRKRAFDRTRQLRIECGVERDSKTQQTKDSYKVFEGTRFLAEASGPLHPKFSINRIRCCRPDPTQSYSDLMALQLQYNSGKPFVALEKIMLFARLKRESGWDRCTIIKKTGLSRTHVNNAEKLNAADPRVLEYVRNGMLSQKLALRLLRDFSPTDQVEVIKAARAKATSYDRVNILPKDIDWPGTSAIATVEKEQPTKRKDQVRSRVELLKDRLAPITRRPPNDTAASRLNVYQHLIRFFSGETTYSNLEAFLLGRT